MPTLETVSFADVEVVNATGPALIVRVKNLRVTVPRHDLQDGTTVHADGDRGRLVIARWLADTLGLT